MVDFTENSQRLVLWLLPSPKAEVHLMVKINHSWVVVSFTWFFCLFSPRTLGKMNPF